MGLSFTRVGGPRQRSYSQVRVPRAHDHMLLSQIRDSPTRRARSGPRINRNRVARLYPQALDSFTLPHTGRRATVQVFDSASTRNGALS
jgi:hypothetical protein